ncbi:hypothetical protein [Komagataeibacter sp. FXV3]|uniref:hypothetical protein n=1 Tax=Komagataeibacter sp. FXV3 TaxID=2608998 RepID=UPI00187B13DC|nr:hypothetical protein [Komagataeibacter sp. FXV3]MBE7730121.1 hypothetical protein [Komagataeibacter sp. FXV3]
MFAIHTAIVTTAQRAGCHACTTALHPQPYGAPTLPIAIPALRGVTRPAALPATGMVQAGIRMN